MSDILAAPFWLSANLLLALAAWRVARRLYSSDCTSRLLMHSLVLSWAAIVLMATLLGICGTLCGSALVATVSALATGTLWWLHRSSSRPTAVTPIGHVDQPILPFSDVPSPTGEASRSGQSEWVGWAWLLAWGLLGCFWFGHIVTGGLLRFPDDWDTLMYHLPLVDHWLQARSLLAPDSLHWSNPGNNELLALWFVAPFSGDFLASLNNLPAAILLALAAFQLACEVGLRRPVAHLAALAVVSNFVVLRQLTDCENDVATAALFLACLAYGLRYAKQLRGTDLALGSVTIGLLAGVKFYALGYVTVVAAVALLLLRHRGSPAMARATAVGALGLFIFSGYWYVRNTVVGGSPLYPLGGTTVGAELRRIYPNVWQTTFLGNGRPELFPLALSALWQMTGPCHLAAVLGLPISLVWLVGAVLCGTLRGIAYREARLALALSVTLSGVVLLVTPFAVEDEPGTLNQMHSHYCPVRYGLCFLSLAVLTLATALHTFTEAVPRLVAPLGRGLCLPPQFFGNRSLAYFSRVLRDGTKGLLLCLGGAGIVFQLVACHERLRIEEEAVLIAIDLFSFLLCGSACSDLRLWRHPVVISVLMLAAVGGTTASTGWLAQYWHAEFGQFYDRMSGQGMFAHLAGSTAPGSKFCVLDYRPYPFFGSRRQFRICQPETVDSYPDWLAYLRDRQVSLVAIRFDLNLRLRQWERCQPWLDEHADLFTPVRVGNWAYNLYGVKQGVLAETKPSDKRAVGGRKVAHVPIDAAEPVVHVAGKPFDRLFRFRLAHKNGGQSGFQEALERDLHR